MVHTFCVYKCHNRALKSNKDISIHRETIFTEPDVLASPVLDMDATFNIVLQQSLYKTGRLQMRLQRQGMQISKPYRVHPNLYQACLTYTAIARLSPQWNKVADWMIQGRDFVNHDGYTSAIKMNFSVNKEEIYITVAGTAVRFPPLQVEDLNLRRSEMQDLLKSTEGVPWPVEVADAWCHVLPSMKRGKIASLSLTIPKESPFPSYKELKRHWKNMYGYRLPDTDEDILYCQIGFLASGGGKSFTYPSVCLRAGPVQVVPRVDPKPMLTAFLQDLHARMTSVCGMSLKFQPRLRYAAPALHNSAQPPVRINLSTKPLTNSNIPMRDNKSMAKLFQSKDFNKTPLREKLQDLQNPNSHENIGKAIDDLDVVASSLTSNQGYREKDPAQPYTDTALDNSAQLKHKPVTSPNEAESRTIRHHKSLSSQETSKAQAWSHGESCQVITPKKFVPLFRPKCKTNFHNIKATSTVSDKSHRFDPSCNRLVPTFKSQKIQNSSTPLINKTNASVKFHSRKAMSRAVTIYPNKDDIATKTPQHLKMLFSCNNDDNDDQFYNLNDASCTVNEIAPTFSLNSKKSKLQTEQCALKMSQTSVSNLERSLAKVSSGVSKSQKSPSFMFVSDSETAAPTSSMRACVTTNKTHSAIFDKATHSSVSATSWVVPISEDDDFECFTGSQIGSCHKRKQPAELESTLKKPRAKPQLQNLDVEALARANQLSKVNAITLAAWLKDKNVTCKSKDKKNDLVDKVNSFLNLTRTEQ